MPNENTPQLIVVRTTQTQSTTMRGVKEEARRLIEDGIPVDKLQQGYARFMDGVRAIISSGNSEVGQFNLEEVSFSAEIGAEGEFKLLGTGVGVSASSGITFVLRRQK